MEYKGPYKVSSFCILDLYAHLTHNLFYTGGRPSGECYAVFISKSEALRAVNELNMQKLGSRFLELFTGSNQEYQNFMQTNFASN